MYNTGKKIFAGGHMPLLPPPPPPTANYTYTKGSLEEMTFKTYVAMTKMINKRECEYRKNRKNENEL